MRCGTSKKTSNDLFSEYVNYFVTLKQESSGFPDWVKTPKNQARYVDEYYRHEGILLHRDKIVKNPSLRAFGKLYLNSLWVTLLCAPSNDKIHY